MLAKLQRPSSQAFPTTLHYKLRMRDERCDAMRGEKIWGDMDDNMDDTIRAQNQAMMKSQSVIITSNTNLNRADVCE